MSTSQSGQCWWQPWTALALFAFLLNFVWEFLQVPWYREMSTVPHWAGIRMCTTATAGDVVILLAAYALSAVTVRSRWWIRTSSRRAMAVFIAGGIAITIAFEWLNVYVLDRWAYASGMPLLVGIGLSPLLQWVVVPPATLWLARRHLGGAPGATSSLLETST